MDTPSVSDLLMRPPASPATRILFMARHVPEEPAYLCRSFPGDGGYPAYYHRVWQVLTDLGYPVRTANHPLTLLGMAGKTDLVFSLYNRMPVAHPEIVIPSLCTFLGLPCVGAPPNIRALAEDKWLTKLTARALGIPVAAGAVYAVPDDLAVPPSFPGPYFVKGRFGAASEGVSADSIQDDWSGGARVASRLLERGRPVLVETFAPGIDLTVPVLGGAQPIVLGVVRPRSDQPGSIITEHLKRDDPLGYELIDAAPAEAAMQNDVAALWAATGPMDYFRMDYRVDPHSGERVFLEFNLCCHIGRSSAICLAASRWGLEQAGVLGHVVEFSLRRQRAVCREEMH